jgi:hypothetical protein
VAGDVVIVVEVQRVGKLRLQTRVTLRDVEWVRVICDVEQLSNVGLLRIASVLYAQGDMLGHHEI